MNIGLFFEKRSKAFWGVTGLLLILLLGVIDYLTGYEIILSLFYLIPIALVAWYAGGRLAFFLSAVGAIVIFISDYAGGLTYSNFTIYIWNVLLWEGFFFVTVWLIAALKRSYDANMELARQDYVTGAMSIGFFYTLVRTEISRSSRYKRPFTFVYIDIDNFKSINDRLGHSIGDRLLRSVAENIRLQIRPSDTFARLGGDEFGLLLPETNEDESKKVISRMLTNLTNEMARRNWEVTFSMGAVTFQQPPATVDDMVKLADSAMYSIKTTSKNGVAYRQYAG